jgi:hypothetical protein
MDISVLLLAAEPAATQAANVLRHGLPSQVEVVTDQRDCLGALRHDQYTLVLLEDGVYAGNPEGAAVLLEAAGTAYVLDVNFAICSAERVLLMVRSALKRRAEQEACARSAAVRSLHNDLNAPLTGLLLESQLALRQAGAELAPALRHIVELAEDLRRRLGASADTLSAPQTQVL